MSQYGHPFYCWIFENGNLKRNRNALGYHVGCRVLGVGCRFQGRIGPAQNKDFLTLFSSGDAMPTPSPNLTDLVSAQKPQKPETLNPKP